MNDDLDNSNADYSNSGNSENFAAGREIIKRYVVELPHTPGVYRMFDNQGRLLYVGKARNLKDRVSNYINAAALNTRLQLMVARTARMEFTTTRSEAEALLLEANMIKKNMPRYNILLRDDKSFPYILISGDHDFPRVSKHRGAKNSKGKYFGPFVSAASVDETILWLQKAFLLRPCSDNIFKNRTRPCLQYQIKRCSAPCVAKITSADYAALVAQAEDFLAGKSHKVQQEMAEQMQNLALKMQFEKAAAIRDRIKAITQIQQNQAVAANGISDADVIALAREAGMSCLQLFSFRGGRNYGNKCFFPQHTVGSSDSEVLANFISQFYHNHQPPPLIMLSHAVGEASLLEEALKLKSGSKIDIITPLRGAKHDIMQMALTNAREAMSRHLAVSVSQRELLKKLRDLLAMSETPARIEIYDNSHIQGNQAVGAMVVADRSGFLKNSYRLFTIRSDELTPGDDYAMMREVLTRRFWKLHSDQLTENDEDSAKRPDLVLIDGGAGHLKIAREVFEELGIQDIVLAAIAKGQDRNAGREWIHLPDRAAFQLAENDPLLHYLQRLRDEAHRFAIGAHRGKRKKTMRGSALDEIPQIGAARKKALLSHFGSAQAISNASAEEIAKVQGISKATAKMIYEHFHHI